MGTRFCIAPSIEAYCTRTPFLSKVNGLPSLLTSQRYFSQKTALRWSISNSDNVGNCSSHSTVCLDIRFFSCVRLHISDLFMPDWLFIRINTVARILFPNLVLTTRTEGNLDSASAAWCSTPAVCTTLNSYFNNPNCQLNSFPVVSARIRFHLVRDDRF